MITVNRETLEFVCGIVLLIIGGGITWFGIVIAFAVDGLARLLGVVFALAGLGLIFCGLYLVRIIEVVVI